MNASHWSLPSWPLLLGAVTAIAVGLVVLLICVALSCWYMRGLLPRLRHCSLRLLQASYTVMARVGTVCAGGHFGRHINLDEQDNPWFILLTQPNAPEEEEPAWPKSTARNDDAAQ